MIRSDSEIVAELSLVERSFGLRIRRFEGIIEYDTKNLRIFEDAKMQHPWVRMGYNTKSVDWRQWG